MMRLIGKNRPSLLPVGASQTQWFLIEIATSGLTFFQKEQEEKPPATRETGNRPKFDTGRSYKHDWQGALIAMAGWIHANGRPDQPKPLVDAMRDWFENAGKTDPAASEIADRASRLLKAVDHALKK
jgi:hypothetical protein